MPSVTKDVPPDPHDLMTETLASIEAPPSGRRKGFYAGIVLWGSNVVVTAPIVRYMRGWTRQRVRDYCREKGWKVTVIHQLTRPRETAGNEYQ